MRDFYLDVVKDGDSGTFRAEIRDLDKDTVLVAGNAFSSRAPAVRQGKLMLQEMCESIDDVRRALRRRRVV